MHWHGMPGARPGMPILNSRGEIQACMWAWHAKDWAWHASTKFQEATMDEIKGAWHSRLSVARLTHQLLWACHLSNGVWHANSPFQEEPLLWRATWYRSVARQLQEVTWAFHLRTQAWHVKLEEFTNRWACYLNSMAWHAGVPLEQPGVARQCPKITKARTGRATWCRRRGMPTQACHYGVPLEG
ncbi:hypothetical protein AHAS_Ahas17G0239200 [Arachis hypogaea]